MHIAPKLVSTHRVARLHAWFALWLVWFTGVFAAWRAAGGRMNGRALQPVANAVARVVVLRVAARMSLLPPTRNRHGRLRDETWRTAIGSRLRAALRRRDGVERLFAILGVMRDIDQHVARLLRRLKRGLTRLRVILPARVCEDLRSASLGTAACCDSS